MWVARLHSGILETAFGRGAEWYPSVRFICLETISQAGDISQYLFIK